MTTITWDGIGTRFYEAGVSKGVFYGVDSRGIPWNGLTSVESSSVDTVDPLYFDGLRYADLVTLGDFEGVLKAFTYPDEFAEYEGSWQAEGGFYMTGQPKTRFGLSYRTEISNDLGESIGYKIHLLYNLLAIPANKTYETLSLDTDPVDLEWDITAIPEEVDGFRPTAYVVIDSRKIDPFLLTDIEDIIYGTAETDPKLPDLNSLVSFVQKWGRLIITDLGDGRWQADSPIDGVITMLDATTFQIVSDTAIIIDPDTYTISSSEGNEDELWPP
jgi:hypothetical protein